ncbi:MAG: hypothetical protein LBN25_01110 [Christensenellaceae bacterium]|jgi:hypothetical protein|nr:hypothetical protein [Christensenellaceae bacterium]
MNSGEIVQLTVIAQRGLKQDLVNGVAEHGGLLINTVYGRGFVKSNDFLEAFGFVNESDKIVITALTAAANVDKIFAMLNERFEFNKPNTGIAFTIPVNGLTR